ncbi:MAG: PspC domain-containing protein [Lishizhenia sp.]
MKKTISINLSGIIYYIEEDGFDLLKEYLENIRLQFKNKEEADMILEDVEIRIAELFNAKLSESKTAILFSDVQEVISIMGEASDYSLEEERENEEENSTNQASNINKRKLYRDPENGSFGGVAAGLASYFNVDTALIRVLFVILVLAGFSGILIYLILWIVLPKVNSTSDRLKMSGQPITVESISKQAKETGKKLEKSTRQFSREITEKIEPRFKQLGEILSKLIGIGLVLFCAFWLTVFLIFTVGQFGLIGTNQDGNLLSVYDLSKLVLIDGTFTLSWLAAFIIVLCPLIGFTVLGLTLLFKFQTKTTKRVYLTVFSFWIIALITGAVIATKNGLEMAQEERIETEIAKLDTNQIDINWLPLNDKSNSFDFKREEILKVSKDSIYFTVDRIRIYPSKDNQIHVYTQKIAHGNVTKSAINRIENMQISTVVNGNHLEIPAYFSFPKTDKIRNQSVTVVIEIPLDASATITAGNEKRIYSLTDRDDRIYLNRYDFDSRSHRKWSY